VIGSGATALAALAVAPVKEVLAVNALSAASLRTWRRLHLIERVTSRAEPYARAENSSTREGGPNPGY
jgi:hypothetical protein